MAKVTLIRDFGFPGKTIKKGTEIEITEDRIPGMVKAGLIDGPGKKEKRKVKTEKASLQDPKIES